MTILDHGAPDFVFSSDFTAWTKSSAGDAPPRKWRGARIERHAMRLRGAIAGHIRSRETTTRDENARERDGSVPASPFRSGPTPLP
jgi:hypothetical protein